jgi:hypothetical protein
MLEYFGKVLASALLAYSSHYAANKFYNYICVPDGIYGYLQGFITIGSPICQTGLLIISNTQVSYTTTIMNIISRGIVDYVAPSILVK